MFRAIFPSTHWRDVLDLLDTENSRIVEIQINRYGVIVDDTLVSFISEIEDEVMLFVQRDKLRSTRTNGLVEIRYHSNHKLLIEDAANQKKWLVELALPIK
ncbi:MAG TPA: hypothetical protein DE179_05935 [Oceanospirillaceae bacterium]|nr:hypothetical protein [Oceanospirillaceae bacterium]